MVETQLTIILQTILNRIKLKVIPQQITQRRQIPPIIKHRLILHQTNHRIQIKLMQLLQIILLGIQLTVLRVIPLLIQPVTPLMVQRIT